MLPARFFCLHNGRSGRIGWSIGISADEKRRTVRLRLALFFTYRKIKNSAAPKRAISRPGARKAWLSKMDKQVASSQQNQGLRYLLILGCTVRGERPSRLLQSRIDCAAQYLRLHPQLTAVASGGCFRAGQSKSEAAVIRDGLRAAGIAPERILLEDQARSTAENFTLCKQLLEKGHQLPPREKLAFVTNDFHVARCLQLACRNGLHAVPVPAPTPKHARLRCRVRECLVSIPLRFTVK